MDTCPNVVCSSAFEMYNNLVVILAVVATVAAAPVAHQGAIAFHHVPVAPVYYAFAPRLTYDLNTVSQVIAPPRQHLHLSNIELPVVTEEVAAPEEVAALEEVAAPEEVAVAEEVAAPEEVAVAEEEAAEEEPAVAVAHVTYDLSSVPQVVAPPRGHF